MADILTEAATTVYKYYMLWNPLDSFISRFKCELENPPPIRIIDICTTLGYAGWKLNKIIEFAEHFGLQPYKVVRSGLNEVPTKKNGFFLTWSISTHKGEYAIFTDYKFKRQYKEQYNQCLQELEWLSYTKDTNLPELPFEVVQKIIN